MHDFLDHLPRPTMMAEAPRLRVRWADALQREQIVRLDNRQADPMGVESIYRHFKGPQCVAKIAERGTETTYGPVIGYLLYEKAGTYFHVNRVRVAGDHRRQGIGRMLVEHVKGLLSDHRPIAEMMVNECDLATQLLLRSCGFECINTFEGYYGQGRHARDAYSFRYVRSGLRRSFMQEEGR